MRKTGKLQAKKICAQLTHPCDQVSQQIEALCNMVKIVKFGQYGEIRSKL